MKKTQLNPRFCLLAMATCLIWGCGTGVKKETPAASDKLYAAFEASQSPRDTLHFFLPENPSGRPVSDSLLKICLDSTQFEFLHFQTGDPHFWADKKYPLSDDVEACLLHTNEFWFKKQTLLLYHKTKRTFFSAIEVASFYGGDGGQIAVESWLFHTNGTPHLYVKNAEHWVTIKEEQEAPTEQVSETGNLLRWEAPAFKPRSTPDSTRLLQNFRMHHQW